MTDQPTLLDDTRTRRKVHAMLIEKNIYSTHTDLSITVWRNRKQYPCLTRKEYFPTISSLVRVKNLIKAKGSDIEETHSPRSGSYSITGSF